MKMFNAALTQRELHLNVSILQKKLLEHLLRCHPAEVIQKNIAFCLDG